MQKLEQLTRKTSKPMNNKTPKAPWGYCYIFCEEIDNWTISPEPWLKNIPNKLFDFMNRNIVKKGKPQEARPRRRPRYSELAEERLQEMRQAHTSASDTQVLTISNNTATEWRYIGE